MVILEKFIGEGSYGQVWRAKHRGRTIALKYLLPEDGTLSLGAIREVSMLQHLRPHPRIIRVLFVVEEGDLLAMGLDYHPFTLEKFATQPRHDEVWLRLAFDLLDAVQYLHDNNVVHRDIKPANILISEDNRAVLCDFSLARVCVGPGSSEAMTPDMGCHPYMAPEVLKSGNYHLAADNYSVGVIVGAISKHILDLGGLCDPDPRTRMTCAKAMEDPAFKGLRRDTASGQEPSQFLTAGLVEQHVARTGAARKHVRYLHAKMFDQEYVSYRTVFERPSSAHEYARIEREIFKRLSFNLYN